MISIQSVSHSYPDSPAISFEDLRIKRGEKWLLLGESGSGKTTFLHILTGILMPTQGKIVIHDTDLYKLSSRERDHFRGKNIGLVFQQPHLIKSLTVQENLLIAQSFAGMPKDKNRIGEVLSELGILQKKNNYPYELSQGQLQRASIARAVLNKPALIVADEPTSSLDNKNAQIVIDLLIGLSESVHATLVVSTHDDRIKQAFSNEYMLSSTNEFH